jgi:hypothetical protein
MRTKKQLLELISKKGCDTKGYVIQCEECPFKYDEYCDEAPSNDHRAGIKIKAQEELDRLIKLEYLEGLK